MLKEFVHVNHGSLDIYSEDGYVRITHEKEQYIKGSSFFQGTAVNITLCCDEKYYRFVDEGPSAPWF